MRTKIVDFFETNNLTKEPKQMSEFMLCYVEYITELPSFNLSELHMQILEFIVESNFFPAKYVSLKQLQGLMLWLTRFIFFPTEK